MALKRRLWLLALLTLLFLGALARYRRAPSAIQGPPALPVTVPPAVTRPTPAPSPAKPAAQPDVEAPPPPQPPKERGAGLKEKGESIFGGSR